MLLSEKENILRTNFWSFLGENTVDATKKQKEKADPKVVMIQEMETKLTEEQAR